jgi:hypothetical protein
MNLTLKFSVLALAAALSAPAMAADPVIGAGGYIFTAALPIDGTDFTNTFNFKLGPASGTTLGFSAEFFNLSVLSGDPSWGTLSFPQITFSLIGTGYSSSIQSVALTNSTTGTAVALTSFTGLHAGQNYSLKIEGKGVGFNPGWGSSNAGYGSYFLGNDYSVSIAATGIAAAVPEPESYAMLLAGLGLMGAVARRRTNG